MNNGLSMGLLPSIIRHEKGQLNENNPNITIQYNESFIYLTGIHANFYGNIKTARIIIYFGELDKDEKNIAKEDIIYEHYFTTQNYKNNKKSIGEFKSLYPNVIISSNDQSKIIKIRLSLDFDRECSHDRKFSDYDREFSHDREFSDYGWDFCDCDYDRKFSNYDREDSDNNRSQHKKVSTATLSVMTSVIPPP